MRGYFRLSLPAAGSLAVNGLLLLMLFQLGIGQQGPRKEEPALTVMSLAVPLGVEDALEDQQAEQKVPAQAAASVSPPIPQAKADSALPIPPVILPAAQRHLMASPAAAPEAPAAEAAQPAAAAGPSPPPRKGATDGLKANAPAGSSRSYAAKIRSWLYAHKTYPRRARMRREEGVVRVRFVLDRQGQLLEGQVIGKSGFAALDEEGHAMLSRASPYPAAPQDILGSRIEFTVPIEWQLPA